MARYASPAALSRRLRGSSARSQPRGSQNRRFVDEFAGSSVRGRGDCLAFSSEVTSDAMQELTFRTDESHTNPGGKCIETTKSRQCAGRWTCSSPINGKVSRTPGENPFSAERLFLAAERGSSSSASGPRTRGKPSAVVSQLARRRQVLEARQRSLPRDVIGW